jgi:GDP-4-dehydro-6-deoxy-D-mannose reductase
VRKILITGGTGFVGMHLIRFLKTSPVDISVLSSAASDSRESAKGVRFYQGDIRNGDDVCSIVRDVRPVEVFHLAGVSAIDLSWRNPSATFEVNVVGAHNLFEAAMALPAPPRILNVSTAQVYAPSNSPLTETSFVRPDNPYGASKAMAELLSVQYCKAETGGIITARSFNHSGPGQGTQFFLSSIAKQFVEIESGVRPPRLICGNIEVERDFSDVRDIVRAYSVLVEKGRANEIYNVCSGSAVRLADVIKKFETLSGIRVAIESDPGRIRSGEVSRIVGDCSKIRQETGWNPQIPLDDTLRDLLNYWRDKSKMRETIEAD